MFRMVLRAAACVAVAAAALVAVPGATAETVVTLTGETLGAAPTSVVNVQCGTSPTNPSTVDYDATGPATGPYPGTFVEHGSVTFHAGVVQHFSASFTIFSGATTITGTKQLDPETPLAASCGPVDEFPEFAQVIVFETYQATVSGPLATFTETGRATTSMNAFETTTGTSGLSMAQGFDSGGPPGVTIEISPLTAVNPTGTTHTVTAIVRYLGEPVQGATVLFTITGSSGGTSRCVTDAEGKCSLLYQGPDQPGADEITACADTNVSGTVDAGEPCAAASKAWSPAAATPGGAEGGGYIRDSEVAFGFAAVAVSVADPVRGGCSVIDRVQDVHVKCLDITSIVITPTHATFLGTADQDGIATNYQIDVDDLSESGSTDTFKIVTGRGYAAAGLLTGGNIRISP